MYETAAALDALRDARTAMDYQIDQMHREINRSGITGDVLAFEEGRLEGTRMARTRINNLIDDIEDRE